MNELHNQTLKKTRIFWIAGIVLGVVLIMAVGGYFLAKYRKEQVYAGYIDEGDRYYNSKQYEKAVVSYKKAIETDDKKARGYEGTGNSYIGLQEYSMARVYLKKGYEMTGVHTLEVLYDSIENAVDGTELEGAKTMEQDFFMDDALVSEIGGSMFKEFDEAHGYGSVSQEGETCVVTYKDLNAKAYYIGSQDNPVINPQTGKPFDAAVPDYLTFNDLSVLFPQWEDGIYYFTLQNASDGTAEVRPGPNGGYLVYFTYLNCDFEIECDEEGNITNPAAYNKVKPTSGLVDENKGSVSGSVVDATKGTALDSVTVKVVAGEDSESGDVIQETSTDGNGEFSMKVPEGTYTIEYAKEGYITVRSEEPVRISAGNDENLPQVAMSPTLGEGEWRFVLQWGSEPADLDLHVMSDDYHVFFGSRNGKGDNGDEAMLDVDDTNGEGPETITVNNMQAGVKYDIMVYNYSYHSDPDENALSNSGATVTVYTPAGESYTYDVPSGEGNIWEIVTVKDGEIVEHNDIVSGDVRN